MAASCRSHYGNTRDVAIIAKIGSFDGRIRVRTAGKIVKDIFEFWKEIKDGERVHPADKEVFKRLEPEMHGFRMDCLPHCYSGPLKTAPVVLLYASPGYEGDEETDFCNSPRGRDYYRRMWTGTEPLSPDAPGAAWFRRQTRKFEPEFERSSRSIAILDIGAYHSVSISSYSRMLSLPSSRVTLDWAQRHLFKQAENGERVVICLRAHSFWGLERGKRYKGKLFSPQTTRGGHMISGHDSDRIVRETQAHLNKYWRNRGHDEYKLAK